jgi:pSer/pThr/pTyr-binding forkhead associated (FHA) protein
VEIRVEGWQVLVLDRGSTNGTVITIPGRQPQRLRAGEPFPLPVGATVNLADEAQFVYEVDA